MNPAAPIALDAVELAPPILDEPPITVPAPISLRAKTVRSSMWTIMGFGGSQAIRFCSGLIMMRLLVPHDFGLVALVGMFVNMFQQFSDIGLGPAIIQSPRGDEPRFLNTAWTVAIVRGLILWLVSCAVAWPAARICHEPMLFPLIVVTAFGGVFSGLNSTALFQLNRHMQVGKITALNLAAQIVTTIVMISIAWKYHTVWAIIIGVTMSSAFTCIVSHFLIKGFRNRFAWDRGVLRELFHFGGWIFISTALTLIANDVDRIIFSFVETVTLLGLYHQATTLVRIPIDLISRLASVNLFPALARSAELGRAELTRKLIVARNIILPLGVAGVVGLAFGAMPFVHLLYPGKFQDVGWMARYMSVGLWITLLQLSSDRTLLALGHVRSLAMANGINMIATIVFAFIGLQVGEAAHHAMPGFILGVAVGNLMGHLIIQSELARLGVRIYLQDVYYTLLLGALAVVGLGGPKLLDALFHFQRPKVIEIAFGLLMVAATCAWAGLRALRGMR
jgi:O-antigen/teichoic acid export membrane protein